MHETGVCRSIVETVERFALAGHAKRVKTVRIKLGEVHDVVPEILIGAFEWMARGTVAEGAEMVIERIPFTVKCELCGEVYRLDVHDERTWDCPACHQRAYHLHTGREFLIDAIEIENYAPGETDDSASRLERLQAEAPDIICVVAFGCLLPDAVLELAPLGCVNVHGSLLPKWRGAAPIQRAVLEGDERIGISIMRLVQKMDAGDFCRQASVELGEKGCAQVMGELSELGAQELCVALDEMAAGTATWTAQDESEVTFAAKIDKAEMRLDPGTKVVAGIGERDVSVRP